MMNPKIDYFNQTRARWDIIYPIALPNGLNIDNPHKVSYSRLKNLPLVERVFHKGERPISSKYWFTDKGVYRLSDHWGYVGTCQWVFKKHDYSDLKGHTILAFAYWDSFEYTNRDTIPKTLLEYKREEWYRKNVF